MTSAEAFANISLTDPDGRPTNLGDYAADPLAVILVRYFGCLPCQHYLRDLDRAVNRFPSGSRVIAVGGSSTAQAQWLRDTKGIDIPLLLDPTHRVRSTAQLGTLNMRQLSKRGGMRNYARAMRNGFRPQVPTRDITQAPGIAVFKKDCSIEWVHRGEMLGDYPTVDEFLLHLRSLTPNS